MHTVSHETTAFSPATCADQKPPPAKARIAPALKTGRAFFFNPKISNPHARTAPKDKGQKPVPHSYDNPVELLGRKEKFQRQAKDAGTIAKTPTTAAEVRRREDRTAAPPEGGFQEETEYELIANRWRGTSAP